VAGDRERALLEAFREAARAKILRDIERERADAEIFRDEALGPLRVEVERLRSAGRCHRVWLFGSYAWGAPTAASDLDLLIESDDDPFALAAEIGVATRRMVHVVPYQEAPPSLIERAVSEGMPL
jgi:predicted nucleotidyltransferase